MALARLGSNGGFTVWPSEPLSPHGDGVVNDLDVTDFYQIFNNWRKSSHCDFNFDGFTNNDDLTIVYVGSFSIPFFSSRW